MEKFETHLFNEYILLNSLIIDVDFEAFPLIILSEKECREFYCLSSYITQPLFFIVVVNCCKLCPLMIRKDCCIYGERYIHFAFWSHYVDFNRNFYFFFYFVRKRLRRAKNNVKYCFFFVFVDNFD